LRTEFVLLEFNTTVLLGILAFCALTDILYRRVSETGLGVTALAMLAVDGTVFHARWWLLLSLSLCGVSLGALWWMVDRSHALGDAEMVGMMGMGLGPLALVPVFLALVAALVSRPFWPVLAGSRVQSEERRLAPLGVYFFLGLALTVLLFLAVLRP